MAAVVQNQMGHVARATIFSTLLMILLCSTACKSLNFGPFNLMTKSQKPNKLSGIVELVAASNYGLNSSLNVEIISLINDLKVSQPLPLSDSSQVDGFWELLWTTEKVIADNRKFLSGECEL